MRDALDPINIIKKDKYIEDSNKFDFIIKIYEIRFKNKKEMEKYNKKK
ncbi:hypothetical protein [Streptobacillus felis]|uniref:Uncharacterized protein n=1 Tax=Streptobacillus felis TaxID=1384509 RepID=A0A7Z0PG79_9FUSO|nr:hypothetical protein [Streptobacillus felis]NYV28484.1 hypothetical protein [Streptobacillus felis]